MITPQAPLGYHGVLRFAAPAETSVSWLHPVSEGLSWNRPTTSPAVPSLGRRSGMDAGAPGVLWRAETPGVAGPELVSDHRSPMQRWPAAREGVKRPAIVDAPARTKSGWARVSRSGIAEPPTLQTLDAVQIPGCRHASVSDVVADCEDVVGEDWSHHTAIIAAQLLHLVIHLPPEFGIEFRTGKRQEFVEARIGPVCLVPRSTSRVGLRKHPVLGDPPTPVGRHPRLHVPRQSDQ